MAEMPVGVHWPVVHRARELQAAGMPIALLTNNVTEWGDHWRATFPVDELFEIVVDPRARSGCASPIPRSTSSRASGSASRPRPSVFIDDNAENIAAARALGMETVHFGEDPFVAVAELDAILARRGMRIPTDATDGIDGRARSKRRASRVAASPVGQWDRGASGDADESAAGHRHVGDAGG